MPKSTDLPSGSKLDNRRVGAALIDIVIMAPFVVLLYVFAGESASFPLLAAGWALFYYFAWESGAGQTPGKHLMRLRVMRADGREADMGAIAVRTALRPVDSLFGYLLGLLVMLRTGERRQRIGDLAAKTIVTDARLALATAGVAAPAALPAPVEDQTYAEGWSAPDPGAPELDPEPAYSKPEPPAEAEPVVEIAPEPVVEPAREPVVDIPPEPVVDVEPEPDFLGAPLDEAEPVVEIEPEPDYLGAPLEEAEPVVAIEPEPDFLGAPLDEAEPAVEVEREPVPEPFDVPAAEPQSAADLLFGGDDDGDEPRAS